MFDNQAIILEDPRLRAFTAENVWNILGHSYWWPSFASPLYRPLTTLSYFFNYAMLGNAATPAGYHAVNLIVHLANVGLVLEIARRLTPRFWLAWSVAAVWGLHPILTEAVTNIVGRADLLAAFGTLGALYCHMRSREPGAARGWLAGVVGLAAVGMFSKESGVAVLGVLALYDLFVLPHRPPARALLTTWALVSIPLALLLYQRALVADGATTTTFSFVDNPILGADPLTGRLTALVVAARYLWLLVWPARLSADYSFPQIPLASGTAADWAAALAVVGLAAVSVAMLRHSRAAFFALAAAFATFLPASNLVFAGGTIMAERLMYLPSLGILAAAVVLADLLFRRYATVPVALTVMLLIVGAAGVRTFARNGDWRDELTLWRRTAETAPRSFKAHSGLAEALYQSDAARSALDEALAEKEKSLALLAEVPDPAAAIKPYFQAAAYRYERGDRLARAGNSAAARADFEQARTHITRYLALLPAARQLPNPPTAKDEGDAQLLLSSLSLQLDEGRSALALARQSRAVQPFEAVVYQTEAAALIAARQLDEAAVVLLTGFIITGKPELRAAVVQLYGTGLDAGRCATRQGPNGVVLDVECEIVHRHLCAASAAAADTFEKATRPDLAEQARANARSQFKCQPS